MRKILLTLSVLCYSLWVSAAESNELLQRITSKGFEAKGVGEIVSLPSGSEYAALSADAKAIVRYSYQTGKAIDTIFNVSMAKEFAIEEIEGFEFDSLAQRILFYTESEKVYRRSFKANYYVYRRDRKQLLALSDGGKQQCATFSPNGRMVAFVRDNNVFVKKLDFNTEIAVTTNGSKGATINGMSDWVYEEEFGVCGMLAFSPDSKMLAYVRLDESEVPLFSFQWFGGEHLDERGYPTLTSYKYPRAGEKNAVASLHVYDVFYKTTKTMNLGETSDGYIPKICWGVNADVLFAFRLNRNQNQLDMYAFNPRSAVGKVVFTERSEKYYVDYSHLSAFTPIEGNQMLWMSEADGYRHLYLYNWYNGQRIKQLTLGAWDVTAFYGYDAKRKVAYYQSAEVDATERAVYAVDMKGRRTCLTPERGTHHAQFSATYSYFVDNYSTISTPNSYTLHASSGKQLAVLASNDSLLQEFRSFALPQKSFMKFAAANGEELNGWMLRPIGFDESKRYPVLMVQYSGPNSQEVRNRWSIGWEYYLATKGYIVVCVDSRGTAARGEAFRKCNYRNLGTIEVDDQVAVARYLAMQPYVDATRIGIWGWSYGGYVTLASMIKGEGVFKVGIAVAPVTDWKLYDSAYTERYMRRPQENFKGYEQSSLLDKAADLQGSLLLVHGTADDNVHMQNTLLFSEALIEAGVQFDMMLYPNKNHSILGDKTRLHLFTKMSRYLFENL